MKTLCIIRDLYRAVHEFETSFQAQFGLSLNEGMLICSLDGDRKLTSGEIAEQLGLANPTTSKVIKSVENKGMIERVMGDRDKRQMYFSLTDKGAEQLEGIKNRSTDLPEPLENYIKINRGPN